MKRFLNYLGAGALALALAACGSNGNSQPKHLGPAQPNQPTNNQPQPPTPNPTDFVWDEGRPALRTHDDLSDIRQTVTSRDTTLLGSYNLGGATPVNVLQSFDFRGSGLEMQVDAQGPYLGSDAGQQVFTYQTEFFPQLEARVDLLNGADISDNFVDVIGSQDSMFITYNPSSTALEMTLLKNSFASVMQRNVTYAVIINGTQHLIELVGVNNNADRVSLNVNGATAIVHNNKTAFVNGLYVGVQDAFHDPNGFDDAEIHIAENALTLSDDDTQDFVATPNSARYNGVPLLGTDCTFNTRNAGPGNLELLSFSMAYRNPSNVRVRQGESLRQKISDPAGMVSDTWDLKYVRQRGDGSHEVEFREN